MNRNIKISLGVSATGLVGLMLLLIIGISTQRTPQGAAPQRLDIGGDFALSDVTGQPVTQADFAGRPMLIFFGFTYCPDVCPTTLDVLGRTLETLEKTAPQVYEALQPVFISVDPARDTPAQMADYLSYFHPKIIGLTGTAEQTAAVKKAYRVYAVKRPETDANGNYNVDHSSLLFLMDGDNRYLAHFDHSQGAAQLARRLADKLAASEN